jgi:hypothetical protein
MAQMPPQQSNEFEQTSPVWMHHPARSPQVPADVQYFEQHSPAAPHEFPADLHVMEIGVHVPPVHLPPQHEPSVVQAWLSEMHCVAEQVPLTQLSDAQSVLALHPPPVVPLPRVETQVCAMGSHIPEQH